MTPATQALRRQLTTLSRQLRAALDAIDRLQIEITRLKEKPK